MPRCSTPDTLIGVGGGGSKVVYRFMQQRWILDEVLDDRTEYNGDRSDELQAVTIDSAVDEGWHGERATAVEETIQEAIADSNTEPMEGYLQFEGPKIVPDMIPRDWKGRNLTSPGAIKNLANDPQNGLTSWWMKDGREPLASVNSSGFNGGVHRLRSLSKALYHIAQYNDKDLVPNQLGDEVCLVAALGGGTGSGMILDLATDLSDKGANIHLFGILPHENSGSREKTNAFAALSELEYAHHNDESPFESITLIPHIKDIESEDREFEMAVVRTILAQQQMSDSDSYLELLPREDDAGAAPAFAPFTVAVPNTVRYDLKVIEQAEEMVDEVLERKRTELQREADLYDVVETYLTDAFPDTAKPILENHQHGTMEFRDGDGLQEAVELRERIEDDILETLLSQEALEIAGLEEIVRDIQEQFEPLLSDDELHIPENKPPKKQAAAYVERVPDNLSNQLEGFNLTDSDGRPYELVEALKQEFENIRSRRNIWKAVSEIDTENVDGLSEIDAKLIRRGIIDVTIDEDQNLLGGAINNPTIKQRVLDLRNEYEQLTEEKSTIESFWEDVCTHIKETRTQWYTECVEDAKHLAAIKADRDDVAEAIDDLSGLITDSVDSISGADQVAEVQGVRLNLKRISSLGEDGQISGIGQLNQKLAEMGVDEIPVAEIEERFEQVKKAKILKLEHGTGWFGADNSEEFPVAAVEAQEGDWFRINKGSDVFDVTHGFEAEFVDESIQREYDIDQVADSARDSIVSTLERVFTDSGSFESFSQDGVSVPQGTTPTKIKQQLQSDLEDSDETSADELLDDVLPVNEIDRQDVSLDSISDSTGDGAATLLLTAYLQPIYDHYTDHIVSRLEEIGSEGEKTSLINRLEKVRALAEGPDGVSVSPPQAYKHRSGKETYGNDFVDSYDGIYELPLDETLEYRNRGNPYLTDEKTEPEQMIGSPDHIGETDIIEDEKIERNFAAATRNLFENSHGQAPFNTLQLEGTGQRSGGESAYTHLRVRQVYLSRALGRSAAMGYKYDSVYQEFADHLLRVNENADIYKADQFGHGWDDDVTMVSFIGGIFLDNISLVTERDGYQDNYEDSRDKSSFIGSHHTVGMGGRWGKWSTLGEWAAERADDDASVGSYGAHVYREQTRIPDSEFVEDILVAYKQQDKSAQDIFNDMLEASVYESTQDLD